MRNVLVPKADLALMKVLYVAMKYDYGVPRQGYSYEHYNFFDSLLHMGNDVLYFDFGTLLQRRGRAGMNQRLLEVVRSEKPDVLFSVLFRDELEPAVIDEISASRRTQTVNWFTDDHWRFETFSKRWAPHFNWVVTTAESAVQKYWGIHYERVIKSQWACNHFRYRPIDLPRRYDVSFVGLPHGNRRALVRELRRAGIEVQVWGRGWANGRVGQDEMIRIFNQTRINLNLSNSSLPPTQTARVVAAVNRLLESVALPGRTRDAVTAWLVTVADQTPARGPLPLPQIKGRNFEVPGCGGFLLSDQAENLADYFVPGKEVVTFGDIQSLAEAIRYHLSHQRKRKEIAAAGYARTIQEHTYVHRFAQIFDVMGLPTTDIRDALAGRIPPGQVQEII
jgi:spore maturation protein CgeB